MKQIEPKKLKVGDVFYADSKDDTYKVLKIKIQAFKLKNIGYLRKKTNEYREAQENDYWMPIFLISCQENNDDMALDFL